MIKNTTRFVFGSFFLFFGILILMINFDILQLSFWKVIDVFWPVGLILAGVLLMLRKKAVSSMIVVFTIILALISNVYVFEDSSLSDAVTINQKELIDNSTKEIFYNVDFGGGSLNVYSGFNYELYNLDVTSFYLDNEVGTVVNLDENMAYVDIDRSNDFEFNSLGELFNIEKQGEDWELFLNPTVPINLNLDFGASETTLDLSELMIKDLDLDFGASETKVVFAKYPTKADFDLGASSLELLFPENYQVMIEYDGGLSSTEFNGFSKVGKSYVTDNFKYDKEYIYIKVDAGASEIHTKFY